MNQFEKRLLRLDEAGRAALASELREYTKRNRKTVLKKAYSYICRDQDEEVLHTLILLASDVRPKVRTSAAYALGDHPSIKSRTTLCSLLSDTEMTVRSAAEHALQRLDENERVLLALDSAISEMESLRASKKLGARYQEIRDEESRLQVKELQKIEALEGKVLTFLVQGSRATPYQIRACRKQGRFMIECSCQAAIENMLCKHILWILEGDTENLRSANSDEVRLLPSLLKGTPAEAHYSFALGWLPESKREFKAATKFD